MPGTRGPRHQLQPGAAVGPAHAGLRARAGGRISRSATIWMCPTATASTRPLPRRGDPQLRHRVRRRRHRDQEHPRRASKWGPSANITVKDCVMETKDSGLKIGTETIDDVHDIRFERCEIKSCCRGLTIQLRDEGRRLQHRLQRHPIHVAATGGAVVGPRRGDLLTAIPRTKGGEVGKIHDVRFRNITGRAENSIRIERHAGEPRSRNVTLENVASRSTAGPNIRAAVYDNRPTTAYPGRRDRTTRPASVRVTRTRSSCRTAASRGAPTVRRRLPMRWKPKRSRD